MAWILHLPILFTIGWILSNKYQKFGQWVSLSLLLKVLATVAFGLLFLKYYGHGDTLVIHRQVLAFNSVQDDGFLSYLQRLFEYINPYQGNPRTLYVVRLIAPLSWLCFDNYWLTGLYISLFFMGSCWRLISKIAELFPLSSAAAIISCCFLPTVVFWNTGISKDAIANGCFFLLCSFLLDIWSGDFKKKNIGLVMILFWSLMMSKHYLAGTFFFLGAALVLDHNLKKVSLWKRLITFGTVAISALVGIRFFFIRLRPERLPITVYELNQQILSKSGGSTISFDLEPTWTSLISQLPKAIWAGLFMPLPWNTASFLELVVSLENLVLVALFVLSLWFIRKARVTNVLLITGLFVMILATMLPLTTPNLGSLSRYKAAFIPFFFMIISTLPMNYWRDRSV